MCELAGSDCGKLLEGSRTVIVTIIAMGAILEYKAAVGSHLAGPTMRGILMVRFRKSIRQPRTWLGDTNPVIGERGMHGRTLEPGHVAGHAELYPDRARGAVPGIRVSGLFFGLRSGGAVALQTT